MQKKWQRRALLVKSCKLQAWWWVFGFSGLQVLREAGWILEFGICLEFGAWILEFN